MPEACFQIKHVSGSLVTEVAESNMQNTVDESGFCQVQEDEGDVESQNVENINDCENQDDHDCRNRKSCRNKTDDDGDEKGVLSQKSHKV